MRELRRVRFSLSQRVDSGRARIGKILRGVFQPRKGQGRTQLLQRRLYRLRIMYAQLRSGRHYGGGQFGFHRLYEMHWVRQMCGKVPLQVYKKGWRVVIPCKEGRIIKI